MSDWKPSSGFELVFVPDVPLKEHVDACAYIADKFGDGWSFTDMCRAADRLGMVIALTYTEPYIEISTDSKHYKIPLGEDD